MKIFNYGLLMFCFTLCTGFSSSKKVLEHNLFTSGEDVRNKGKCHMGSGFLDKDPAYKVTTEKDGKPITLRGIEVDSKKPTTYKWFLEDAELSESDQKILNGTISSDQFAEQLFEIDQLFADKEDSMFVNFLKRSKKIRESFESQNPKYNAEISIQHLVASVPPRDAQNDKFFEEKEIAFNSFKETYNLKYPPTKKEQQEADLYNDFKERCHGSWVF